MDFSGAGALIDGPTGAVCEGRALSERLLRRKEALSNLGVRATDRVAMTGGNSPDYLIDVLALWSLGACAIPVPPSATEVELSRVLEHSQAQMVISPAGDKRLKPSISRESGEALILYTSGTTSDPKGVVHTLEGLRTRFETTSRHLDSASWKRVLCMLPLHFGHGLICNGLWPWLGSKDLVLFPSNDLEALSRLGEHVDRYRVDFFSSVPSMWNWVLHTGAKPPRENTLKRVACASARLDRPLWEGARAWLGGAPLANVYGTTETASWIAGTDGLEPPDDGLVGKGWGCAFEARRTENGVGEIWAKTGALMKGYLGRPDLTAEVVRDGWFRTGDLGFIDARERLHLKGRIDDVINKSGMKVYPDEVEDVIKLCAGVADACVFAEAHPIFGEEVAAAVVAAPDALPRVRAWCEARLSPFKIPRSWHCVESLPRGERGKLSRRRVSELFKK
jgi:acyl-CoA synthetase (AMP-forming)/AMP-acid ligase II